MFRVPILRCSIAHAESLIRTKQYSELSRMLTTIRTSGNEPDSEEEWHRLLDRIITDDSAMKAVIPSLLISTAARDFSLSNKQKFQISQSIDTSFHSMSQFDKIVVTIGVSQLGVRTPEVVSHVSGFLSDEAELIPEKFIPPILLAMANLAINNQRAWGTLIARVPVESLELHALSNLALAVATSRSFPIALVERIIDTAVKLIPLPSQSLGDILTMTHSLTCLEVFQTDLFRVSLDKLSRFSKSEFDSDSTRLLKQIILSLFMDQKASPIIEAISPSVWHRFDKLVDWSIPEPQRIHEISGEEIENFLVAENLAHQDEEQVISLDSSPRIPLSLADWNGAETAKIVAMDRFYLPDVHVDGKKIFVHIDDETFIDCIEGPIDPFLQVKHQQVTQCGYKLIWIREQEYMSLEDEDEKRQWLRDTLL